MRNPVAGYIIRVLRGQKNPAANSTKTDTAKSVQTHMAKCPLQDSATK